MVRDAPATAAPVGSVTMPVMLPRSLCPNAESAEIHRITAVLESWMRRDSLLLVLAVTYIRYG
jgi:hypothetical protein